MSGGISKIRSWRLSALSRVLIAIVTRPLVRYGCARDPSPRRREKTPLGLRNTRSLGSMSLSWVLIGIASTAARQAPHLRQLRHLASSPGSVAPAVPPARLAGCLSLAAPWIVAPLVILRPGVAKRLRLGSGTPGRFDPGRLSVC